MVTKLAMSAFQEGLQTRIRWFQTVAQTILSTLSTSNTITIAVLTELCRIVIATLCAVT
jgi:ABC-type spermidine/putrescine transport system permease subunit II